MSNGHFLNPAAPFDHQTEENNDLRHEQLNPRFRHATTQYAMELMGKAEVIRKRTPSYLEQRRAQLERTSANLYGLERIYEDRVMLTPYSGCHCRYCAKRTSTLLGKTMSEAHLDMALEYLRNDPRINTAVIIGGDPMAKPQRILRLLEQLAGIPHINRIRIGTRHILFQPERLTEELAEAVAAYNQVDIQQPLRSRNVSMSISVNHADELLPEIIAAVQRFTRRGVSVRGQTVLLKGINDNQQTLKNLIDHFLAIGITPYYLLHCMDMIGTRHLRTSVQKGIDLLGQLAEFSGTYAMPYAYTTLVGKHRLTPGHHLEYEEIEGERFIRARSPYKADRFKAFSSHLALPALHEIDDEGYIISRYRDGNDEPFGH